MFSTLDPHQYTVKKTVSCCGVGLHSGRTVNLSINPAPQHYGIRFLRTDVMGSKPVLAHMDKVIDTRLATTIGDEYSRISTTEHLLAALKSYGIDNAEIELDSPEVPIMDGSAAPFISLLKSCGRRKQHGFRKALRIKRPIFFQDNGSSISIHPYDGFKVSGTIDFQDSFIQTQNFSLDLTTDRFDKEVSKARTFGYVEQVEELWANGLALGGTLENVIAIHWNRKSVLNEDGLRYEDEFIRHKVLDIIGDMALLGCQVFGEIRAEKTGHTQHLGFMQTISNSPECWEFIELGKDGDYNVLHDLVNDTKNTAHDILLPFLSPVTLGATAA